MYDQVLQYHLKSNLVSGGELPEGPMIPTKIAETGLGDKFLCALMLRAIQTLGLETTIQVSEFLKLSPVVVDQIFGLLRHQALVEVRGSATANVPVLRFALTDGGRAQAFESTRQCEYLGPAPIPLATFKAQVIAQSIQNEKISVEDLTASLSHLVLPKRMVQKLGPAVNSSRSLLVYGPPGNGKTSISEAIAKVFKQEIYLPYAVEVDGQVIRVFDPTVHTPIEVAEQPAPENVTVLRRKSDPRWTRCRRPVILVGGELTLDMLDLRYDANSRFYEAPPQVKALGGVFIIDDFGRQLVQPKDLLNRWIVPLEKRVDYLTIHTGKKFDIPFDELIIFSTNISPNQLMDAALLRRVKYKLRIDPPTVTDYLAILQRVCDDHKMTLDESILNYLLDDFYPSHGDQYAAYHPIFIVEHAIATCRYLNVQPHLTIDLVRDALDNLYISDQPRAAGVTSSIQALSTTVAQKAGPSPAPAGKVPAAIPAKK
jgi:hypothetical protein